MTAFRDGRAGEERAGELLRTKGYEIVDRNVRGRRGEVDLVVRRDDTLTFVEVKTWRSFRIADLEFAIDARKRRRIATAARVYLSRHPELGGLRLRFDVVLLGGTDAQVHHIEDAFAVAEGWV